MATSQTPVRPLPVWGTARRAYLLLWLHRAHFLRHALPGFALVTAGMSIPIRRFFGMDQEKIAEAMQDQSARQILPWLLAITAGTVLMIAFGAAWRRFLLLDMPLAPLEMSRPFRRYLVQLVFGNFLVSFVLLTMAVTAQAVPAVAGPIVLLGAFGTLVTMLRYSLSFTATLINVEMNWRQSAQLMRGNLLRYTATWIITVMTVLFVNNILAEILLQLHVDSSTIIGALLFGGVNALVLLMTISLTSSIAALSYDYIMHGRGPAAE